MVNNNNKDCRISLAYGFPDSGRSSNPLLKLYRSSLARKHFSKPHKVFLDWRRLWRYHHHRRLFLAQLDRQFDVLPGKHVIHWNRTFSSSFASTLVVSIVSFPDSLESKLPQKLVHEKEPDHPLTYFCVATLWLEKYKTIPSTSPILIG